MGDQTPARLCGLDRPAQFAGPKGDEIMTLTEWQSHMERHAGEFTLGLSGCIRHRRRVDADGERCCPIVADLAVRKAPVVLRNICAKSHAIARLAMEPADAKLIIRTADDSLLTTDSPALREWMEKVLVGVEAD